MKLINILKRMAGLHGEGCIALVNRFSNTDVKALLEAARHSRTWMQIVFTDAPLPNGVFLIRLPIDKNK